MSQNHDFLKLCHELEKQAIACPFCKSSNIYIGNNSAMSFAAHCRDCFATGPVINYPNDTTIELDKLDKILVTRAFNKWNKRKDK